jgi:glycosyltransferase involved in cell wall biosynthesis
MKILIIHNRYFITGGVERYLFNIISVLEERGHKIIPFSVQNEKNCQSSYSNYFAKNIGNSSAVFVNEYPKALSVKLEIIKREFYSFYVQKCLETLIKDTKPDICYLLAYKRTLSPSVVNACKKHNIPIVQRISDFNLICANNSLYRNGNFCEKCKNKPLFSVYYKCVKNSLLFSLARYLSAKLHNFLNINKKIDKFICTNEFMKLKLEEFGFEKEKLIVLPTFFNEKELKQSNDIKAIEKISGIVNFLFIGNFDESKGIFDFLTALCLLKNSGLNFKANLIGGLHSDIYRNVEKIIKENNLSDFVEIFPFRHSGNIFEFYERSHVTVLPARWAENLPNIMIESIYFNRPVIVPAFGSFLYTTDKSIAFYFKAHSAQELGLTMQKIIENPEIIIEKSKSCRKFYMEHFTQNEHYEKLMEVFNISEIV